MKLNLNRIIAIIMTTFYINGCVDNNDNAIQYFEERYFPVEKIIDADNNFQAALDTLLSEEPDDSLMENEYHSLLDNITNRYDVLFETVKDVKSNNIPAADNDFNLDRAYKALVETYYNCCNEEYKTMLSILRSPDDDSDRRFNELYRIASQKLNAKIDLFYESVEVYAKKHNVEINLEE